MSDENEDKSIITPKRRDVLLVVGSTSIAGCMGGEETGESNEDTVTIQTTEDTETDRRSVVEGSGDGEGEQKRSENGDDGEDENESSKSDDEENDEEVSEEDENEETDDGEDENEDEGDEEATDREEVTVAEIVSAHRKALDESDYSITAEVQGEESPEDITKRVEYVKETTVSGKTVTITESSTADNSVESLTQEFTGGSRVTEVEFVDGERASGSVDEEISDENYPINVTGGEIVRQLLGGATLTATYFPEDESGTTGEFEITGHETLDITGGEVVINEKNIIESFTVVWNDDDRIKRDVDISIREL